MPSANDLRSMRRHSALEWARNEAYRAASRRMQDEAAALYPGSSPPSTTSPTTSTSSESPAESLPTEMCWVASLGGPVDPGPHATWRQVAAEALELYGATPWPPSRPSGSAQPLALAMRYEYNDPTSGDYTIRGYDPLPSFTVLLPQPNPGETYARRRPSCCRSCGSSAPEQPGPCRCGAYFA